MKQTEVELCELTDFVVPVGPKLYKTLNSYLASCKKEQCLLEFTPGILTEFSELNQGLDKREVCKVLGFGRGDSEGFRLKGFDIAARAVAKLSYCHLLFVGAAKENLESTQKLFLDCDIPSSRLRVRPFLNSRDDLKKLFCEADLVVMPSRTEGFGLTGLEALSAGLPIRVSRKSEFGEALMKIPFGRHFVIDSDDQDQWAKAIEEVCSSDRSSRLEECEILRKLYRKTYCWKKQSECFIGEMISMTANGPSEDCQSSTRNSPELRQEDISDGFYPVSAHSALGTVPIRIKLNSVTFQNVKNKDPVQQEEAKRLIMREMTKHFLEKHQAEIPLEQYPDSLSYYLKGVRDLMIREAGEGSLRIVLECRTLKILERLWEDYSSGHLNEVAEERLLTDEIRKKYEVESIALETTITVEDYLACKLSLTVDLNQDATVAEDQTERANIQTVVVQVEEERELTTVHFELNYSGCSASPNEFHPQQEKESPYLVSEISSEEKSTSQSSLTELPTYLEHVSVAQDPGPTKDRDSSLRFSIECRDLESLERLWSDYRSGRLNWMAEKCLLTDDIKNKFHVESATLETSILEEDYLACKEHLSNNFPSSTVVFLSPLSLCFSRRSRHIVFESLVKVRVSFGCGFRPQGTCLVYFSRNSSEDRGNSTMGDCDDTEILVTDEAFQAGNIDDLGIQTPEEAICRLNDQSKAVLREIQVEDKTETMEETREKSSEKKIVARKMKGHRRYVTLCNGCLHYYKREHAKTRRRQVSLEGYSVHSTSGKEFVPWTFRLHHSENSDHDFAAKSEKETTRQEPPNSASALNMEDKNSRSRHHSTTKKLKVAFLAPGWSSTVLHEINEITKEMAKYMAKSSEVEIYILVPKCSDEDKKAAESYNINLVEASEKVGYAELHWLGRVPNKLLTHVVEEIGKYKENSNPKSTEENHKLQVRLCRVSDFVVTIGPRLHEIVSSNLRPYKDGKRVFDFTPGILEEFTELEQSQEELKNFRVVCFCGGGLEDFTLQGVDIVAKAVAKLGDCNLLFIGAADGMQEETRYRLLGYGIDPKVLTIRSVFHIQESLKDVLLEVDLAIMPSREEGFSLICLKALSAGLPILVSKNSGLGEALMKIPSGSNFVVSSDDHGAWVKEIAKIRMKDRCTRLKEVKVLRHLFQEAHNWEKQIETLICNLKSITNGMNFGDDKDGIYDNHKDHDDDDEEETEKLQNLAGKEIPQNGGPLCSRTTSFEEITSQASYSGKDTYDLRQPAFMEIPSDKRGSEKFPLKSTEENLSERGEAILPTITDEACPNRTRGIGLGLIPYVSHKLSYLARDITATSLAIQDVLASSMLVLPRLEQRISESEQFRYKITDKELFILLPKTCFSCDDIEQADSRVKWVGNLPESKINREGSKDRSYKHAVHEVGMHCPADGTMEEYYFIVEYATPLMTLYDMFVDAQLTGPERDQQIMLFTRKLSEILDENAECRGKYKLVPISGNETNEISNILFAMQRDVNIEIDK
ncbi:Stimulator of interferon genes protein [Stylophora pistillata]|uniref:Stimulator of interferon genes protein n=1 Tax=Stylophora pistillata TaxID=50429 RepID=A0A2B4SH70_STYPI|nr:Stimulator of interferon genes protein [Stylophora pistillata]